MNINVIPLPIWEMNNRKEVVLCILDCLILKYIQYTGLYDNV